MCHTAQKTSSKEPFRPSETLSVYRKSQCCICDSGNMDALLGPNHTTIMDRSVKTVDGIHLQNFIEFLKPRFLACTSGIFKSELSLHSSFFVSSYKSLNVTRVNTYGLVFHWQGSTSAKPYILAAHQGYSRSNILLNFG